MKTTLLLFILLFSLSPLQAGAEPAPGSGESALEILQRVRATYASLPSFSEEGVITSTGGAGREVRFELGAAAGKLSLSATGDFDYGEDGLDAEESAALVVPVLLADAGWPGSRQATLERQEPCGASTCWVIELKEAPEETGAVLRLWVDTGTYYLWRTERRGAGNFARTVVVEHEPRQFSPPAGEDLWATATALEGQRTLEGFSEQVTVALSTVSLRVVDPYGRPVTGLRPEDFKVVLAGQELPVNAVDWISSSRQAGQEGIEPGKLVVFFVQAAPETLRLAGQMRQRRSTRELLAKLDPEDRIAVLSFDSHLKLRQDFTGDREAVHQAIDQGMRFGSKPLPRPPAGDADSLAAHLDFERARAAASPERALLLTGNALASLPGEKVVVFLGYGLGELEGAVLKLGKDFDEALLALKQARATVFVIDVTQANEHSMGGGLMQLAVQTGGTYASTYLMPDQATRNIADMVSGYYVLSIDSGRIPEGGGLLQVTLSNPKRGTVLARPTGSTGPAAPARPR